MELSDPINVEQYCVDLLNDEGIPRIHVLINNAAQTITRTPEWCDKMGRLERSTTKHLTAAAMGVIVGQDRLANGVDGKEEAVGSRGEKSGQSTSARLSEDQEQEEEGIPVAVIEEVETDIDEERHVVETEKNKIERTRPRSQEGDCGADSDGEEGESRSIGIRRCKSAKGEWILLDESGQPFCLEGVNSWSRRCADVGTEELRKTLYVNAIAPFLFCSKLKTKLVPVKEGEGEGEGEAGKRSMTQQVRCKGVSASGSASASFPSSSSAGLIVNVTALEGKFNVMKKSSNHPHTNMAKAALNMLTLTSAREYARAGIYMSSVDTGWVTDMAPGGLGVTAKVHETFIGPPLDDEDGAARVLDPVFSYIASEGEIKMFGNFYKDYMKASW